MDFAAFKSKVTSDAAFAAEFEGKKPSEIVELAKAKGYNISVADFRSNLTDSDLDAVAGGNAIINKKFFIADY